MNLMLRSRRLMPGEFLFRLAVGVRGESAVFNHLREFEESQFLPDAAVKRNQTVALARALTFARDRTRRYGELLAHTRRIVPDEARNLLSELPLLTKRELQTSPEDLLVSPLPKRVSRKTTGGSTGQTVTVLKDPRSLAFEMAATWRGYGWAGLRIGDRAMRWWGRGASLRRRLRSSLADLAMNRVTASAFAFSESDLLRYWNIAQSFRPAYFYGYSSMLAAFARFVVDRGLNGRALRLRAIVSTSEVLDATTRQLLAEVFGAGVYDEYGCGEVGPIAFECNVGSLHISAENLVVEVLKPDGTTATAGESGQVVVSDLHNRAMPLLRYALGDNAEVGESCSCGRGLPTLSRVWGRAYDMVLTPSGTRFHGEFFMYLFEDLRVQGHAVDQFQVVQRSSTELLFRIVTSGGLDAIVQNVQSRVRHQLAGMTLHFERVDGIPRAPSGKIRLIVNLDRAGIAGDSIS